MRGDILLDSGGDLRINEDGDITLTTSIRQAVQIRLRWLLSEWRFSPQYGVPWLEEVLVKNPNEIRVRQIVREECMGIDGVTEIKNINLAVDSLTRQAVITLQVVTAEQTYTEEVKISL